MLEAEDQRGMRWGTGGTLLVTLGPRPESLRGMRQVDSPQRGIKQCIGRADETASQLRPLPSVAAPAAGLALEMLNCCQWRQFTRGTELADRHGGAGCCSSSSKVDRQSYRL